MVCGLLPISRRDSGNVIFPSTGAKRTLAKRLTSAKCQTSTAATATSVRSPNLESDRQVFAKFEPLLRKAVAGSAEANCITIGEILRAITPAECANYFRNSAYA